MNQSVVSVIMPAYNGEKYIGEAIESIQKQSYQNWELIIVEDCSTDRTLSVIEGYLQDPRIKLFRNEHNLGIAASRNKAMELARGEYIAIQDDDDLSLPDRLETGVILLDEHPEIKAVAGYWVRVDETGKDILSIHNAYKNPRYVRACLLLQDCIGNGSAMFRKDFAVKYHLKYRDHMLGMEDYGFWIDFSKHGNISAVDRIVYKQRQHLSQETEKRTSVDQQERRIRFLELQKEAITREGIRLSQEELDILYTMAGEKTDPGLTARDYMKLYEVFRGIIRQAKDLKLENAGEIAIACRKFLGKKIANSKGLWNE